jgi:predicted GH43/DUF377 family glycosyl hydrolase
MHRESLPVRRTADRIVSEPSRVLVKAYRPGGEARIRHVIDRVLSLSEEEARQVLEEVIAGFATRHKNIWEAFGRNFQQIGQYVPKEVHLSEERRYLIGAYFTHEYSVQAAAFFNPSIVPHPSQSSLDEGSVRVIMSFRSTGEGHISSIEFRSGILGPNNVVQLDPVSRFVETPEVIENPTYDRYVFELKLEDMESSNDVSMDILSHLSECFTRFDLEAQIQAVCDRSPEGRPLLHDTIEKIRWLVRSNYELRFRQDREISEKVIFPVSENESRGVEDARFVRFIDDDGEVTYYATYTAYNGFNILPMLLETKDFVSFRIRTLNGVAAQNKGMALFPRKIDGRFVMISRHDGENLFIMSSDNIHFWHDAALLRVPRYPWELIQIGNCGSPVETEHGWILLTHGVGPMRKYCIGACLLDLHQPQRVIGHLAEPLLQPTEAEREGYVPNVVYTCGAMIHNGELVVPYAMSDTASGVAVVGVEDLVSRMLKESSQRGEDQG